MSPMNTYQNLFDKACDLANTKATPKNEKAFIDLLWAIEDFVLDGKGRRDQRSVLMVISYPDVKTQLLAMPSKKRSYPLLRH